MPDLIVWAHADALTERTLDALTDVLDADERARSASFAFARDRKAFVAAHGLLRFALSRIAPPPPRSWRFAADAAGRPVALGYEGKVAFSLSHTRSLVACLVSTSGKVGIDVEEIGSAEPDVGLLSASCSPAEAASIATRPRADRAAAFSRLWTLKEAALKALGLAERAGARDIEFTPDGTLRENVFISAAQARALTFSTLFPLPSHAMSFARPVAENGAAGLIVSAFDEDWVTFGPTTQDA